MKIGDLFKHYIETIIYLGSYYKLVNINSEWMSDILKLAPCRYERCCNVDETQNGVRTCWLREL